MRLLSIALLSFLFFAPQHGLADFAFSPIITTLSPSGPGAAATFTVRNNADARAPIQIAIVHRNPDADGREDYKETPDIDDLFQIYPAQIVLGPKETRSVRVSWIGDPKPKTELAFRIIAEELPINLDQPTATPKKPVGKLRLAGRYIGSLYVTPPGAAPQLTISGEAGGDKKDQLVLKVENTGTAHIMLNKVKIGFTHPQLKEPLFLSGTQAGKFYMPNILAGKQRIFTMPWPTNLPQGPVTVTFELPKK